MRSGTRPCARSVLCATFVLMACGACSSDYWLGGSRGDRGPDSGNDNTGGRTETGEGGADSGGSGTGGSPGGGGDASTPEGRAVVLSGDVVLTGTESFTLPDGDGGPCRLDGNGYQIRSDGAWTGRLSIQGCTVAHLGSASKRAISVAGSGSAVVDIQGSTFSGSGAIRVINDGDSTTTFSHNVIDESSVVVLDPSADGTIPAFFGGGESTAQKLFQGNRILRSTAEFRSPNWLVGGSTDVDTNVLVGLRAGFVLGSTGLVVRGNYVHGLHYTGAGDEACVRVDYGITDTLMEHNVVRGGTWVFRGFGGELRYNAVLDAEYSAWLQQPFEDTKVHHNLFLMCHVPPNEIQAGIFLVNDRASGIEVYNNTLDAGGTAMRLSGAAVTIDEGCFLDSLRSNAFLGFPFKRNDGGAGAVRPGILEGITPPPPRLGYADYNLFYNPQATDAQNYTVSVPSKTVRTDGFGAHDAPSGGPVDAQVDPGPLGLAGGCFPWSDDDIVASKVTLSRILRALRDGYTPASGSALIGAGDPAEGAKNPIGAIGDGTSPSDLFGSFGR